MNTMIIKFWEVKSMEDFTNKEWEAVCMKCGKCCVMKTIRDGMVYFSNRVCEGLDLKTAKCTRYKKRLSSDCKKVTMRVLKYTPELLPETCAYRMLHEKGILPDFHPLITGDEKSVKSAKQLVSEWPNMHSAKDLHRDIFLLHKTFSEEGWDEDRLEAEEQNVFAKYALEFVAAFKIPKETKKDPLK